MSEQTFRPDNGLTIAIFAHILEYYGSIGVKSAIKDSDGINELSVLSRAISDRWVKEVEDFDANIKSMNDAISDLSESLDIVEGEKAQLAEELEKALTPKTKTKKALKADVAPVGDEDGKDK